MTPPPAADTSVSVKDINVKAKTAVKNNTVKVKNIAAVLKKEITKAEKEQGGRIKDLSVEITFDTGKAKNWKNLHLEMDKQAVNLLVKKNVKEWKVNGGNVNLTFDSKALKELKKEMSNKKSANRDVCAAIACNEWFDVRAFGQVFAFKGIPVSFGVRGPVSIHQAVSLSPIDIVSMQITKSVNSESGKESKASDTMGMKHRVGFAVYKVMGSVNVQLAEKTGFSQEDAEELKEALKTLFENDASSARPEGSMEVRRIYWWQHDEKTPAISSGKIQRGFTIKERTSHPKEFEDYDISWNVEGCKEPEVF